jgi:ATPase subunit of ABC transporter with duplicated ATPase domains
MKTRNNSMKSSNLHPQRATSGNQCYRGQEGRQAFGEKLLYDDLNFTLPQAGIVGIIGPNGAGKSTIFRMIMGEEQPDAGEFTIGETVKIAYVDQSHSNINHLGKFATARTHHDGRTSGQFARIPFKI